MTSKSAATEILKAHYGRKFGMHGINADGVDWGSCEKHRLRLQNMALRVGTGVMAREGVLDVGCGYGELLSVLHGSFGVSPLSYTGIDPCVPMIDAARKRHPGYRFEACAFEDFVPADPINHIFCCGVFTKKVCATNEQMYRMLHSFFVFGKKLNVNSITLNAMSPLCDERPDDLFFPDFDQIMNIVRELWGYSVRKFEFSNDYLKYEMLIKLEF
jgi:SAM-dependent methyltransferase